MKELEFDKQLNIQTIGRDDSEEDNYHHPYEPTPYSVLERLADSGYIEQENILIDYGCGKGLRRRANRNSPTPNFNYEPK